MIDYTMKKVLKQSLDYKIILILLNAKLSINS